MPPNGNAIIFRFRPVKVRGKSMGACGCEDDFSAALPPATPPALAALVLLLCPANDGAPKVDATAPPAATSFRKSRRAYFLPLRFSAMLSPCALQAFAPMC